MEGDRGREKGRDGEGKQALNTNELTHIMHALPLSLPLSRSVSLTHTFTPSHTCSCPLSLSSVSPHWTVR